MTLTINGTDYRVRFGYNSFCDSDIFDRVREMLAIMTNNNVESDAEASALGKIRDLFSVTRDLLYIGLKRYNPVESKEALGDLLDDYRDEAPEGENRGILSLFLALTEELMNEGFLSDLIGDLQNQSQKPKVTRKK